ncbi:response regulator transcription factor [Ornithinimicrobium faecis]|uniref:Response regulator transcription factor n=1 Tax=Ornithinimicrobium faecis TaxID=2934158 RepID=A0ABY4YVG9_9MICO|nr:response regulator transcription factor [Ornithinimicrobium sp. HY1793]USQ80373.1 response regulator transcription factor [Ornithinimicrobium sp. HY1793]
MSTTPEPSSTGTISVVLVDDDALVRTGLGLILGGAPDLEVIGEANDGRAGVDLVEQVKPDVVLMDIRMPVLDGLAATAELLASEDPPKVIVLTTFDTDDMVLEALRIGAHGFLLKSTRPERLVEAVRRAVLDGEPSLSPSVTQQLIARVAGGGLQTQDAGAETRRKRAEELLDNLTDREREVAVAIGQGWSNAQIASTLYMGLPTVKAHVSRVLVKLGAGNRTQIALIVHDAGLTDPDPDPDPSPS